MSANFNQNSSFSIRSYEAGDEVKINERFNRIFGQKRQMVEWYWKFRSPNDSRIMVAYSGEDLISHYALVMERFRYHGMQVTAGHGVDTFSARVPDAIRFRLFEKLVREFFKRNCRANDISLTYGFPGTRILKLGRIRLQYGEALPIRYWEKAVLYDRVDKLAPSEVESFNVRKANALWWRAKRRYPVSVVRDGHWMLKRYFSRPNHEYYFIRTGSFSRYDAMAIYRILTDELVLVDLVWDGRRVKDLQELERRLIKVSQEHKLRRMSMWLSGDENAEKVFLDLNWKILPEPEDLHLVAISFNSEIDRKVLLNDFYLTKGCSDII